MITFKRVKGVAGQPKQVCPACGHDSRETDDPCIHERQPELFTEDENGDWIVDPNPSKIAQPRIGGAA